MSASLASRCFVPREQLVGVVCALLGDIRNTDGLVMNIENGRSDSSATQLFAVTFHIRRKTFCKETCKQTLYLFLW